MTYDGLNEDFVDLLELLLEFEADFLVVGAHSLAAHGVARATGDLDVFVRPTHQNARLVYEALMGFGAPLAHHGLTVEDLVRTGTVYQVGLPPRRIDIITAIDGVDFDEAWRGRVRHRVEGMKLPFLGLRELVKNKRASGRPKDLADIEMLRAVGRIGEEG